MTFKLYARVGKELKGKVKIWGLIPMFWGLIPMLVEVTREKLVGGLSAPHLK